ncbi:MULTISPECIES: hypothetical protein [Klebsiella]|uniref:hypothetical protein n=1 Tax=Klebsiella TaxID=570 RepID=UPI000DBAF3A8|nr:MULTISPECIES: hypothetical protein [Klebsiella]MBD0963720.1 hypothetical protein [Klebsiella michiganensis]MBZ7415437.1 hypothetical protein [Klebsiella michiganensis]MDZ1043034.1 hypothetical protein [Klebsiella pneumoniae]MDZ1587307.1 hypothetical protein [Klebsiella pneumoniae]MDZ3806118.1 hypothetical protein [Klebsiella pneumoniae]
MLFKHKSTLEADPATWTAGAAVLSAGVGTYSAISNANKKGSVIKPSSPVTQDASIAESDDLLRRRQRQGNQGNVTGASGTAVNTSGQKTLLGG